MKKFLTSIFLILALSGLAFAQTPLLLTGSGASGNIRVQNPPLVNPATGVTTAPLWAVGSASLVSGTSQSTVGSLVLTSNTLTTTGSTGAGAGLALGNTVPVISPNIVNVKSYGAKCNSSGTGGGTDDTAAIQAAFMALSGSGGGELDIPGISLISGIDQPSNVTFNGLGVGGLYLATSSDNAMITNLHRSYLQASDSNICVENMTLYGNGVNANGTIYNQSHNYPGAFAWFVNAIDFNGVNYLKISHVRIVDARCYSIDCTSCNFVDIQHIVGFYHYPYTNNDIVHFDAPYNYVYIHDVTGNPLDDLIALNGDENYGDPVNPYCDVSGTSSGNVVVDDINCPFTGTSGFIQPGVATPPPPNDAIRILSLVGRVDNIFISNISGGVRSYGISLDNAGISPYLFGNIGSVTISNVNLVNVYPFNFGAQDIVDCDERVDNLTLSNIATPGGDPAIPGGYGWPGTWGPIVRIYSPAEIKNLNISGNWDDTNTAGSFTSFSGTQGRIDINGAWIHNFNLGPIGWQKPENTGSGGILLSMESGTIGKLTLTGVITNNGQAIIDQTGGFIGPLAFSGLTDTNTSGPSVILSDTNTFIALGAVSTGTFLSGTYAGIAGQALQTGTGVPQGRYGYGAVYHLAETGAPLALDSGPNFGPNLLPANVTSGTTAIGGAYIFTGATNSYAVGKNITYPAQFWYSAIVRIPSATQSVAAVCAQWDNSTGGDQFIDYLTESGTTFIPTISVYSNSAGSTTKASSHAINAAGTHLLIFEVDGVNDVIGVSVDGNAIETTSYTPPLKLAPSPIEPLLVGQYGLLGGTQVCNPITISDLVYHPNSVPSSGDISAIWNGGAFRAAPYP